MNSVIFDLLSGLRNLGVKRAIIGLDSNSSDDRFFISEVEFFEQVVGNNPESEVEAVKNKLELIDDVMMNDPYEYEKIYLSKGEE